MYECEMSLTVTDCVCGPHPVPIHLTCAVCPVLDNATEDLLKCRLLNLAFVLLNKIYGFVMNVRMSENEYTLHATIVERYLSINGFVFCVSLLASA